MPFFDFVLLVIVCNILGMAAVENREPYYSIVAPGTLTSGSKYIITVALHKASSPMQFEIGIQGQSYEDKKVLELPNETIMDLEFDLPALETEVYKITAKTLNSVGCLFNKDAKLKFRKNDLRSVIEFDHLNRVYNFGDLVKFRLFVYERDYGLPNIRKEDIDILLTVN